LVTALRSGREGQVSLEICPACNTRVVPTAEGTCPSCRKAVFAVAASNPFGEPSAAQNPYAAPHGAPQVSAPNPLFVASVIFLVGAILWEFYVLSALVMVFAPDGPFRELSAMVRYSTITSYGLMLVLNALFIAGSIAMLRLRPKWLAWTGCILGLVPLFGPCGGLTMPLAIWCLLVLRRHEIDARFPS
jgi:hypothetical protein